MPTTVSHSLDEHAFFHKHPSIWNQLAPHTHRKQFAKDDVVLHHGDSAITLWLVLKGWVKMTRQTPDGKETIIGLCTGGDVFGEAALFPHASYPYHAEVIADDTEIAAVPAETIRALVEKNPGLSSNIMALFNERMAQTQLKLEHLSTMSVAQRLGCFLLRLCHDHTRVSHTLHIPVEKHVLASYLGMKPETLSRSQQQLKPLGVTVHGTQVQVQNVAKLREFVCNSCSESGTGACETEGK